MNSRIAKSAVLMCILLGTSVGPVSSEDRTGPAMREGEMERLTYHSEETGADRRVNVYLPPDFNAENKYPVLYVLHGIGGTEDEWLEHADPRSLLDAAIARRGGRGFIAVFANGRATVPDSVPRDVFSPDAIRGFSRFEEDLIGSLIPFIETRYGAGGDRERRAICGLSMGGGQALNIGLAHPELFGWVGAFSPAPNTDTAKFRLRDGASPVRIFIVCGESDGLLRISRDADRFLTEEGVQHRYMTIPGGHDWPVWTFGLSTFVETLFVE